MLRELGVPDDAPHVNPNGGAIAIGHPLGASGARLVTTAMYQLGRTGGRYALCTMCIGVGQGIAARHRARLSGVGRMADTRIPVGIVGAGPAGLMLGHLLHLARHRVGHRRDPQRAST